MIEQLSNVRGSREANKEAILEGKQYLESFTLSYPRGSEESEEEEALVSVMEICNHIQI